MSQIDEVNTTDMDTNMEEAAEHHPPPVDAVVKIVTTDDNLVESAGTRKRNLTEKGLDFQLDYKKKRRQRVYFQARTKADLIRSRLVEELPAKEAQLMFSHWLSLYESFLDNHGECVELMTEDQRNADDEWFRPINEELLAFKAQMEHWFTDIPVKPDDMKSNTSLRTRMSHRSESLTSMKSAISVARLKEEQRLVELKVKAAALQERRHLEEAKLRLRLHEEELDIQEQLAISDAKTDVLIQLESGDVRPSVKLSSQYSHRAPTTANLTSTFMYRDANGAATTVTPSMNMPSSAPQISSSSYAAVSSHSSPAVYQFAGSVPPVTVTAPQTTPLYVPVSSHSSSAVYQFAGSVPPVTVTAPQTTPLYVPASSHSSQAVNPLAGTFPTIPQPESTSMVNSLVEHLRVSRLPSPEPGVFSGNPLHYPTWKAAFETLITQKGIPANEKIYYLKKYLGGAAKESVEGLFFLDSESAFKEAQSQLDERFGDTFVIANAFRDKLENWPKVTSRDSQGFLKLADFLKQCRSGMSSISSLSILNDERENRRILTKLPDWIISRWGRRVADFKEHNHMFPPFTVFVDFISKEARIASDPVTSLGALKGKENDIGKEQRPSRLKRNSGTVFLNKTEANPNTQDSNNRRTRPVSGHMCILCSGRHELDSCRTFLDKPIEARVQFIRDKVLCFKCLQPNHMSRHCGNKKTCNKCSQIHPTSLHEERLDHNRRSPVITTTSSISHLSDTGSGHKCSMIVPVWVSHRDRPDVETLVYALLDTQSDTTFVLKSTVDAIGTGGTPTKLMLSTMSSCEVPIQTSSIHNLMVRGYESDIRMPLPTAYTRHTMPANRSHIPTPDVASKWPYLEKLCSLLPPLQDVDIGILIGYNCPRALVPREVIPPVGDGPFGQKTDLGWGIVGICDPHAVEDDCFGISHHIVARVDAPGHICFTQQTRIKEILGETLEDVNSEDMALSMEDHRFLDIVSKSIHKAGLNYEMPLPFRNRNPVLPNNRSQAEKRLMQLKGRLSRNKKYRDDYSTFMDGIISNGFAERVDKPALSDQGNWYIPHHGIYNLRKPEKIRVVFDCSANFHGRSLNSELLQGPDMMNSLIGVMCRFRQEPVAFTCDIRQMFFQFKVNAEHRNYLRFLWWENNNYDADPVDYRMKVHLFGAISSPGIANYGLRQCAIDSQNEFGTAVVAFIKNDFYVDDGLKSVATEQEAVELVEKTQKACAAGGLHLHKFVSNSQSVLDLVSEDGVSNVKQLDMEGANLPVIERVLGLEWHVESDVLGFRITLRDKPVTRRGILSTIQSIYDPLGFIAPVVLVGKQILQEMCRTEASWDSPLPDHLHPGWKRWKLSLPDLEQLEIHRCFKPKGFGKVKSVSLHHFSDASSTAYGQCTYVRLVDENNMIHCSLAFGKCRVAPLKAMTIPRLELTAAVLSVKASCMLQKELEYTISEEVFWTDSKVVLGYIRNDSRRFKVFVANRVQLIRNHTHPNQWRYVSTHDNPSDCASRGITADKLVNHSSWFRGPEFLWGEISQSETCIDIQEGDPEIKKVQIFNTHAEDVHKRFELERFQFFSSWHRLLKAVTICMRFIYMLRSRVVKNAIDQRKILVADIDAATVIIVRLVQDDVFHDDVAALKCKARNIQKSRSLYKLSPFLDELGLLRVGGRIRHADISTALKHPVVLPRKHHITMLVIRHFHEKVCHQGRGMTINALRENGFWIIGCVAAVSDFISKCVSCKKMYAKPEVQQMADLPSDRVDPSPPFTYCGVDLFGPWYIKDGRRELKRYGVLFTCMSCRAVHIETTTSLTTDSFINALRRFLAIRGPILQLRSDNGTNFVGAEKELEKAFVQMDHHAIGDFLLKDKCDYFPFKMNAPSASHTGGVWERQIRSVRRIMSALLADFGSQLNDESLRTLLHEVAAIINSRPLTVDNLADINSLSPLSPNNLLTMKSRVLLPPPGEFVREDVYSRKQWRRVQYLADQFWSRWRKEYLNNLQIRQKWVKKERNIKIDDIVLVKDENLPRCKWHLARVCEVINGSDDLVRRVKLIIGDRELDAAGRRIQTPSYLERPIQKLVHIV